MRALEDERPYRWAIGAAADALRAELGAAAVSERGGESFAVTGPRSWASLAPVLERLTTAGHEPAVARLDDEGQRWNA